ncbi:MAG: transglycosylase domain-containing protein [Bacteroidota bacterium]
MNHVSVLEQEPSRTDDLSESPQPPPKRSYRLPRKIFLGLVALIVLSILGFVAYTAQDIPPLTEIENPKSSLSTQVISADGVILDNFYTKENRVNVKLNDISPYVVDALVATEDARFYHHSGVDYFSIPAIIKRYMTGTTSGGSTITMQLARNLFNAVSRDRTVNRKIKEVIVSAILEKNYTKQEIIEAYLNTVNIYGNAYGIEMASKRLFGKHAAELSIEEAAVMVGMLKGQGVFDPIRRPEKVIERRNLVIDLMVRHEFLDPALVDIDSVKQRPLTTVAQGREHEEGLAPYFRQQVRNFMAKWSRENLKSDGTPYDFYKDGLKVYTTLDSRMQSHAEASVREHLQGLQETFDKHIKGQEPYRKEPKILSDLMRMSERYRLAKKAEKSTEQITEEFETPIDMSIFTWNGEVDTVMSPMDSIRYYSKFLETGMISIEPSSGAVRAWVGGINFRHFKYDHVSVGKRQAGSTFKPFVYAAAMAYGRKPCDQALNQPVTFENVDGDGTDWSPENSDGKFGGFMTLRRALATSTNLITARLMKEIGVNVVVKTAYAAGIETHLDPVPSLCLGTSDLSVKELTGAYSTFANQGQHIEPHFITRIEDRRGNVLARFSHAPKQAMNERTAYLMIELLKGVVDEQGGTASRLRYRYNFTNEIAGKTGTTQDHSDGWFMGVTPNLVSGVWVGHSDRRMHFLDMKYGQGANMALPIWAIYMKKLYEDEKVALAQEKFQKPYGYYVNMDCEVLAQLKHEEKTFETARLSGSSDDLDSFE